MKHKYVPEKQNGTSNTTSTYVRKKKAPVQLLAESECCIAKSEQSLAKCTLASKPEIHPEFASVLPVDPVAYQVLEEQTCRGDKAPILYVCEIKGITYLLSDHMLMDILIKHNIDAFYTAKVDAVDTVEKAVWWIIENNNSYPHYPLFVRIEIAQKALPYYEKIAKENRIIGGKLKDNLTQNKNTFQPIDCLRIMGNKAGCSRSAVSLAQYILKHGKPDEIQLCREGKSSITATQKKIRDRIEKSEAWQNKRNAANDKVVFENPVKGEYINRVIHDDAIQCLKKMMQDGIKVDMAVFSPPYYGAGKDYGPGFSEFSTYDEYIFFLAEVIYRLQLIGNKGMRICLNVGELNVSDAKSNEDYQYPVGSDLIQKVHQLNRSKDDCMLRLMGEFVWYKNRAGGKQTLGSYSPNKPVIRNDSEKIIVWCKEQKEFADINEDWIITNCKHPEWLLTRDEYQKYTLQTWQIFPNTDNYRHPAKFPEEIPYRLIKLFTYPGQTVIDCFCGSGTTLKVAKDLGRNFIGIDQNPAFCDISNKRIAEVYSKGDAA